VEEPSHPRGPAGWGPGRWDPARWELWRLPSRAVALVLAVEAAAVVFIVANLAAPVHAGFTGEAVALAAFLTLLSVVHTELATGIERIRRRAAETSYFDLSSVWTFAAALLLPPVLAAAVIAAVYLHLWQRVWRPAKVPLHRHLYTTATVVLAAGAAHTAVEQAGGLPATPDDVAGVAGIAAAVLLYVVVNTLLVAGVIALTSDWPGLRALVGRLDDNALEVATLCMGGLAAVAIGSTPWLVALVLPPILVLHRAVLVRHLEEVASTDAKTGLLNSAAWQAEAARAVRRAQRSRGTAAVLILDLDHFKLVNDAHGHLAGDDVLAAVAEQLRAGVREGDLVGRFGGEEFVVLLADLPPGALGRAEVRSVAERLRRLVAELDVPVCTPDGNLTITGLSVSVGGASVPADGTTLDQVLKVADASLYAAKRGGRNLVRIAGPVQIPAPRTAAG
jgi:diguanylate cyclase (GGDEF)-like protein